MKQVLWDHLLSLDLSITPTLLTTKVVKSGPNFKGGVTSFQKFKSDLRRLLGGATGPLRCVTTMLDYYRLPDDFPGMNDRPAPINPFARLERVGGDRSATSTTSDFFRSSPSTNSKPGSSRAHQHYQML